MDYNKEIFDECYNMGLDAAIKFCKSQEEMYRAISPLGNEANVLLSVCKTLEHFKKPLPDTEPAKIIS